MQYGAVALRLGGVEPKLDVQVIEPDRLEIVEAGDRQPALDRAGVVPRKNAGQSSRPASTSNKEVCSGKHDRRYERRHARKQHNVDDELCHGTFIPATGYYDWHDTPQRKRFTAPTLILARRMSQACR